jgi:hypothetical protein
MPAGAGPIKRDQGGAAFDPSSTAISLWIVMPAQAGIQVEGFGIGSWIPVFAGMTEEAAGLPVAARSRSA